MPSGVSFSPEKEQIDVPLLIRVPGGEGWLLVGGGPLISPAKLTAELASKTAATTPFTIAFITHSFIRFARDSFRIEEATHAPGTERSGQVCR